MTAKSEVPDGGWGWVVVAGTAGINVVNQSLLSLFGLIFGPKLEKVAGTTGVTTIMSLNCTVTNFSGFLISPLSKYFTTQQITQIGIALVASGLAISSYTKNYTRIAIGYGVLSGLGLGLIASSTFLIINSYFTKNKSQAVGLSMAGTSIGQMGMPLIVARLIQHYGYDGTIFILAGVSLHGFIGSMFFHPVSEHMSPRKKQPTESMFSRLRRRISCLRKQSSVAIKNNGSANSNVDKEANLIGSEVENTMIDNSYRVENEKIDICEENRAENAVSNNLKGDATENFELVATDEGKEEKEDGKMLPSEDCNTHTKAKKNFLTKIVSLFDFQMLLDPIFLHIMIGLSLAYTTSISFSTFFPLFLTEDLDMTIIDASTCMSVLSFMDFIGRVIVPTITKRMKLTHRTTFIIGSFLLAACRSLLVIQRSFTMVVTFSAICGIARAATVINQNLVIAEYSAHARVSSALGLNMVSKGIFVLTIGEILGKYKDSAHNFASCIHILNFISISVVISWTSEVYLKKLLNKWRSSP